MDREELLERFNLNSSVIDELLAAGLLECNDASSCRVDLDELGLGYLNRVLTLKNAGIDPPAIRELLEIEKEGTGSVFRQLQILSAQREKQMSRLHLKQKMVDRLDYLIHELKENTDE